MTEEARQVFEKENGGGDKSSVAAPGKRYTFFTFLTFITLLLHPLIPRCPNVLPNFRRCQLRNCLDHVGMCFSVAFVVQ